MRTVQVALLCCLLSGCAETAVIRTTPTEADVFIDGQRVGKSPFSLTVRRSDIRPYSLKVEKEGFEPIGDIISPRIAPGRMVGAFFSLGIVYLFRSPYYLATGRVYMLSPSLTSVRDAQRKEQDRLIGETLRSLDELHGRGAISDEEFNRRRDRLLHPQE